MFNASAGVDPRDLATLDRELADIKRHLEVALLNGPTELRRLHHEITTLRIALGPQVDAALRQVMQAEADLKAVRG